MDSLLRLDAARQIADRALDDARRLGVRISVAVADEAGALLAFARMDGATRLSARTAVAKTQTVILTGKATLDLGQEWRDELGVEPELFDGMIARPTWSRLAAGCRCASTAAGPRGGRLRRDQRPGRRDRRARGGSGKRRRAEILGAATLSCSAG